MENVIKMMTAGLKFSGAEMAEIAEDKKYTQTAIGLISLSVLIDVVVAFFNGLGGSSGMAGLELTGIGAALAQLGSGLIGTFLSAYIMVFVLRLFKVQTTFDTVLRIYGSAIIWTIIGSLIGLAFSGTIAMVGGIICWLAYNFAVLFGLASFTKLSIWKSFLSIVLTFVGVFVCIILFGMIVGMVA